MVEASIARRYARALFELGRENGKVAHFFSQLEEFHGLCRTHPDLLEVISNRFLDFGARLSVVDELATRLNWADEVKNFIKILIRKGRAGLIEPIVFSYRRLAYALENREEAFIISARPLDDKISGEIAAVLKKITGKEIVARTEVRPEVLGGMSVRIAGEIYDGTVRGHLDRMMERMKQTTV